MQSDKNCRRWSKLYEEMNAFTGNKENPDGILFPMEAFLGSAGKIPDSSGKTIYTLLYFPGVIPLYFLKVLIK